MPPPLSEVGVYRVAGVSPIPLAVWGGAGDRDEVLQLSATSSIPLSDGTRPPESPVRPVLSEPHPVGTLAGLIPPSAAADRRARCELRRNYVTAGNNRAQSQRDSAFIHVSFLSSNFKNETTGGSPSLKLLSWINNDDPGAPRDDSSSILPLKSFPLKEEVIRRNGGCGECRPLLLELDLGSADNGQCVAFHRNTDLSAALGLEEASHRDGSD